MNQAREWQFDAGTVPPAFAQHPDLSTATHVGLVDRQPHYRGNSEPRRRGPGDLVGRCGGGSPDIRRRSAARSDRWVGQVVLFGCTFAFFLHLCGGIRHLVWDTVHGFELRSIYISGWTVVGSSAALTVAAWVISLFVARWPQ